MLATSIGKWTKKNYDENDNNNEERKDKQKFEATLKEATVKTQA